MKIQAPATMVARGNVRTDVRCARTGRLLRRSFAHNLVVDAGLALLRDIMYGDAALVSYGAVGTAATEVTAADTALGAETYRDVVSQTTKQGGGGTAYGLIKKFVVPSLEANGVTLREAGLFNAASVGSMYARIVPEAVAKTDAILVIYTWTLTFGAVAES